MDTPAPELDLPLSGVRVLDFSQFLAGPVAALRLADLGATVIKVERPVGGDIGRKLAFAGRQFDGDTVSFHAMNRNKLGVTADLKNADDLVWVRRLIEHADVLVENFRPGPSPSSTRGWCTPVRAVTATPGRGGTVPARTCWLSRSAVCPG